MPCTVYIDCDSLLHKGITPDRSVSNFYPSLETCCMVQCRTYRVARIAMQQVALPR